MPANDNHAPKTPLIFQNIKNGTPAPTTFLKKLQSKIKQAIAA